MFPADQHMYGQTSIQVIDGLLAVDIGKRHFSKWEAKAQQEAIRRCGLSTSSSQYFKNNKSSRIALLTHLHTTALPTVHIGVLRLIAELGLPPSGARSTQQFAYYLLSFMAEGMKFPPWDPIPLLTIVPPTTEELRIISESICEERMHEATVKPNFYRHPENESLWEGRRTRWSQFMKSGVQPFLKALADHYVEVTNLVLSRSPKCEPEDLRCDIDTAQWRVDRTKAPEMFVEAWNAAGGPPIVKFEWKEWKWGLNHLLLSVKRAVAQAVRTQHNDDAVEDDKIYVGDTVIYLTYFIVFGCACLLTRYHMHTLQADARHSYYCVGAVWRSVKKKFCSVKRISDIISKMFVDKTSANKLGLPTQEVSAR